MMPLLSRILGHAGPQSTFYYLHAAPELLALAAARLHEHNTGIASTGISRQEASSGSLRSGRRSSPAT